MYMDEDYDYIFMEGYYDALCEDIEIKISGNKNKVKKTKEVIEKYNQYKEKRKKQGKEALDIDDWIEQQKKAKDLKHDMAKAGIKIVGAAGTVAAAGAVASAFKKKGIDTNSKKVDINVAPNLNTINLGKKK